MPSRRDPLAPGQESVWDYPRPPRVEPDSRHVVVRFGGEVVADTRRAMRVLETSHPPVFYIPPEDSEEMRYLQERRREPARRGVQRLPRRVAEPGELQRLVSQFSV